MVLAPHCDMGE